MAPSKLVQYIKGRSSRRLQEEFPNLRNRYWGQHLWARGYFCATVGPVDEETIKAYIENQRWDEDDQGFKVTAPIEPRAGSEPGNPSDGFSRVRRLSVVSEPSGFSRYSFRK
jgi:hypothetical protein